MTFQFNKEKSGQYSEDDKIVVLNMHMNVSTPQINSLVNEANFRNLSTNDWPSNLENEN